MLKEELYINGESVELIESLNPNLTFNIADIAKPDTRQADFSKTIKLPASKKINKIFEHIFELGADLQTFNPNLKTDVIYLVNGETQIDGYLQIKSISETDGEIVYNCVIIGRVGNFIADLNDNELTDLDLSSLDHVYNKTNQAATWNYPLTTDYVYPMINYDINYGGTALGYSENWTVEDFFPAIKTKKYIDAIFSAAGYTFTSNFFDSTYFNSLIIPFSSKNFVLGETPVLTRIFEANTPKIQSTSNTYVNPTESSDPTSFGQEPIVYITEVRDSGNVYNNSTGVFEIQAGKNGYYDITSMLQLQGEFTAPSGTPNTGSTYTLSSGIGGFIQVNKYNSSGVFVSTLDEISYVITDVTTTISPGATLVTAAAPTTASINYHSAGFAVNGITNEGFLSNDFWNSNSICNKFSVTASNIYLEVGEKVKIELLYSSKPLLYFVNQNNFGWFKDSGYSGANLSDFYSGGSYKLNILSGYAKTELINRNIIEGNTVDMSNSVPRKVKQKEFFMSLVKMFNLYVQPDPNNKKNLLIEPRDDFYSNDIIDWSTKLDKSQALESNPMGALNAREYLYTYKQDKDYYNDLYFNSWNEVYGQQDFKINNEFIKNTHKTEVIFSPTPNVGQYWYDRVLPTIIKFDDKNGVQRTESNIRILQWGGMKSTGQQWLHNDKSGTGTVYTTYPYSGMYNDPYTPTELLEFDITNEIYYSNVFDKIVTFSNNTLFNKYYVKFINEITDVNSKIVSGYFYLTPSDVKNLSFKKQYYFGGQYFRLNKVENYNPSNPLTKCEFLKLKQAQVFTPTASQSHGGSGISIGDSTAALFAIGSSELRNRNVVGNLDHNVSGQDNYVNKSAISVSITGDSNKIFSNTRNIVISGSNNTVESGCQNVQLINTDGQTVTTSNVTYVNNEINGTGAAKTITGLTKANLNVQVYFCDSSGGSFTVDFSPTVDITIGKSWTFKKVSSSNQVTIDASTIGTTIDGSNTYTLSSQYKYVTIQWDGAEFLITSNN